MKIKLAIFLFFVSNILFAQAQKEIKMYNTKQSVYTKNVAHKSLVDTIQTKPDEFFIGKRKRLLSAVKLPLAVEKDTTYAIIHKKEKPSDMSVNITIRKRRLSPERVPDRK